MLDSIEQKPRKIRIDFLNLIILLIITTYTIILTGCSTRNDVVYVEKPKPVYIAIPDNIIIDDIDLPPPPNKESYINSGPIEREHMLGKHIITLYGVIRKYKLKLRKIEEFNNKTKQLTTQ